MEKSYEKIHFGNKHDYYNSNFSRFCDARRYDVGSTLEINDSHEFIENKLLGVICLAFIVLYTVIMFSL